MNKVASLSLVIIGLFAFESVDAQVAGSSNSTSVMAGPEVASGWSVKRSILGRVVYNEANQKLGVVQDLVIAPDRSVSYLIVGTSGVVGIDRHDVAIPITQIEERVGKIVMPGGSREAIDALPAFRYAYTSFKRDEFVANAEWDMTKAREKISDLEANASAATVDARVVLHHRIVGLQQNLIDAEDALGAMQQAEARRWKEFERKVAAATARLRKSTDVATS